MIDVVVNPSDSVLYSPRSSVNPQIATYVGSRTHNVAHCMLSVYWPVRLLEAKMNPVHGLVIIFLVTDEINWPRNRRRKEWRSARSSIDDSRNRNLLISDRLHQLILFLCMYSSRSFSTWNTLLPDMISGGCRKATSLNPKRECSPNLERAARRDFILSWFYFILFYFWERFAALLIFRHDLPFL